MLRQRRKTGVLNAVKELDAFPKVPESYVETTASGGTISIIIFVLIGFFVVSEVLYYSASSYSFKYDVDTDSESTLKINIDITVAMPCSAVGADILDVTNQNADKFGQLNEEATYFELTTRQRIHFDSLNHINTYLREGFHGMQDMLWSTGYTAMFGNMPPREIQSEELPDACRFYGSLLVNKVAGNFHITAGKSIPYPRGHAHISAFLSTKDYNFSHRIERLSFGDSAPGIINPLDAEEKIANKNYQLYQYYLQVVQTDIDISKYSGRTYQYSMTQQERDIDHEGGSHGVPGIYFKYDMSSIKVLVREKHVPYWQFLIGLCGIVGGIFATSGILHSGVEFVVNLIFCRTNPKRLAPTRDESSKSVVSLDKVDETSNVHIYPVLTK